MKKNRLYPFCLLLLTLLGCSKKLQLAKQIQLELQDVSEYRSSDPFESTLRLVVTLPDQQMKESSFFRVSEAVGITSMGDSLQLINERWQKHRILSGYYIALDAPQRSDGKVAYVSGKLDIFTPTEEKNSKLLFQGIPKASDINLLAEYIEDVQLFVVDTLDLLSEIQKSKARYQKQLKEEFSLSGTEITELSQEFDNVMDFAKSLYASPDHRINFLINDPEDRLVDFRIYDSAEQDKIAGGFHLDLTSFIPPLKPVKQQGKALPTFRSFSLREPPEQDWTLEVIIANDASMQQYTFKLQDILLN